MLGNTLQITLVYLHRLQGHHSRSDKARMQPGCTTEMSLLLSALVIAQIKKGISALWVAKR